MILDLDLGNTRAKWRLSDSQAGTQIGQFEYEQLANFLGTLPDGVKRIRMVSVIAAEKTLLIATELTACTGCRVEIANSETELAGVINGYDVPDKLGDDRWMAIVAAWNKAKQSVVVIDAGTAITIDCVDEQGRHLGGYIIPGKRMMVNALLDGTAKIQESGDRCSLRLGKNTSDAVANGVSNAVDGMINNVVAQIRKVCGGDIMVMLTGGDAIEISRLLSVPHTIEAELVLDGLALAFP